MADIFDTFCYGYDFDLVPIPIMVSEGYLASLPPNFSTYYVTDLLFVYHFNRT